MFEISNEKKNMQFAMKMKTMMKNSYFVFVIACLNDLQLIFKWLFVLRFSASALILFSMLSSFFRLSNRFFFSFFKFVFLSSFEFVSFFVFWFVFFSIFEFVFFSILESIFFSIFEVFKFFWWISLSWCRNA